MPDRVSVIATDIDPSTQGLGSLSLMNSSPPMQVNATSAASPGQCTARGPGTVGSNPATPHPER